MADEPMSAANAAAQERVIDPGHPRIVASTAAFRERLVAAHPVIEGNRGEAIAPEDLVLRFAAADPSPKFEHLQWMLQKYVAQFDRKAGARKDAVSLGYSFLVEDLPRVGADLAAFVAIKPALKKAGLSVDINQHTPASLAEAVEPFAGQAAPTSARAEKRVVKEDARADTEFLIDNGDFRVLIPKTEEAAKFWGRGTRWCTAATNDNMFAHYTKDGPLVVFLLPGGEKFQFHGPSSQFMDAADKPARHDAALGATVGGGRTALEAIADRQPGLLLALNRGRWPSGTLNGLDPDRRDDALKEAFRFGLEMQHIDPSLLSRGLCLEAVRHNGEQLQNVPAEHLDREMCLAAVQASGRALRHVPEEVLTDDLILAAVRQEGRVLVQVSEGRRSREICEAAILQDGTALARVPATVIDRDLCLLAVRQSGQAFQAVPHDLRDPEICREAVRRDGRLIDLVPDTLIDRDLCLDAVRADPSGWREVNMIPPAMGKPGYMEAPEIRMAAVQADGRALGAVPAAERDATLCLAAVTRTPQALQLVPDGQRTPEVVLAALRGDGQLLALIPHERQTREMVDAAFTCASAKPLLTHIADRFITPAACLEHVKAGGGLQHVPWSRQTAEILEAALDANRSNIIHVSPHLLTKERLTACIEKGLNFGSYDILNCKPIQNLLKDLDVQKALCDRGNFWDIPERALTPEICEYAAIHGKRPTPEIVVETVKDKGLLSRRIWEAAVEKDSTLFADCPASKQSKTMAASILAHSPHLLRHASKTVVDRDMLAAAVQKEPQLMAMKQFRHLLDEDLCLAVVSDLMRGSRLMHVPEDLRTKRLCEAAIRDTPAAIAHVPDRIRDRDLNLLALDGEVRRLKEWYGPTSDPSRWRYDGRPCTVETHTHADEALRDIIHGINGITHRGVPPVIRQDAADRLDEALARRVVEAAPHQIARIPANLLTPAVCRAAILSAAEGVYEPRAAGTVVNNVPNALKQAAPAFWDGVAAATRRLVGDNDFDAFAKIIDALDREHTLPESTRAVETTAMAR